MTGDHDHVYNRQLRAMLAHADFASAPAEARTTSTSTPGNGEWTIALDPRSGRFRVEFPEFDGPQQSNERWLMLAVAIGLEDPAFREQLVQVAFEHILATAVLH